MSASPSTPEAGTSTLTYDSESNLNTSKDARNITTTFAYDALHRITSKTYSDTTPAVTYVYDTDQWSFQTNVVGRLSKLIQAHGNDLFGYDATGRLAHHEQGVDGFKPSTEYVYNAAGLVIDLKLPTGMRVGYDYNGAGLVVQVNKVNWGGPSVLANDITYHPHSAWKSVTLYVDRMRKTAEYNNRLQPTLLTAEDLNPAETWMSFTYDYQHGTANNGNVMVITDDVQGINYTYAYDELNRIDSAVASGNDVWSQDFSYDRYSNLSSITGAGAPMLSLGINSKNRITNTGFSYDAAGNMTSDGSYTYQYDAESRLISVDGGAATYAYNGFGRRAKKVVGGVTTTYATQGPIGAILREKVDGVYTKHFVPLNGEMLLSWRNDMGTRLLFKDHLGTPRVLASGGGTLVSRHDYYPFGQERTAWTDGETYKFTGYERDAESGNDYAVFRYHDSNIGRFMTPDPLDGSIANPQSLNRYAYVLNDPINLIDPFGLAGCGGAAGFRSAEAAEAFCPSSGGGTTCVDRPVDGRTFEGSEGIGGVEITRECVPTGSGGGEVPVEPGGDASGGSVAAEIENLVYVFNELTTPFQYSQISILAVGSGLAVTTVGVGGQIYFCGQIGPLCTALLPATATVTAGGIFLIKFGVDFTQQQTIPAWKRLFGIGQ